MSQDAERPPRAHRQAPIATEELLIDKLRATEHLAQGAQLDLTNFNLLKALRTIEHLIETATSARMTAVENLRLQGASWAQIGDELGITRQAAQQRFAR